MHLNPTALRRGAGAAVAALVPSALLDQAGAPMQLSVVVGVAVGVGLYALTMTSETRVELPRDES